MLKGLVLLSALFKEERLDNRDLNILISGML